jgi:hypothetical protein
MPFEKKKKASWVEVLISFSFTVKIFFSLQSQQKIKLLTNSSLNFA